MMPDLLATDAQLMPILLEDADLSFMTRLPIDLPDAEIFSRLLGETDWRHEEVTVWGKRHLQPRLTAWHGDPEMTYRYAGIAMHPQPWTDLLSALRHSVEEVTGAQFNSVLLNLYRDNRDRMGFHSDNERELGNEPIIASLSYGATRTLIFKHKSKREWPQKSVILFDGSLLLMTGLTQHHWKHGINSQTKPCGPRINLTLRRIFASS
jgi:alkylated DNA repair dioxygenase AlkB